RRRDPPLGQPAGQLGGGGGIHDASEADPPVRGRTHRAVLAGGVDRGRGAVGRAQVRRGPAGDRELRMPGVVPVLDPVAVGEQLGARCVDQDGAERFVAVGEGLRGQVQAALEVAQVSTLHAGRLRGAVPGGRTERYRHGVTALRRSLRRPNRAAAFGARILGPPDQPARVLRIRVQLLLTVLLIGTHLIGAGLVVVITSFVVPTPAAPRATVLTLAIGVPAYVGLAVVLLAVGLSCLGRRAAGWIVVDRRPSEEERRRTLMIPAGRPLGQGILWLGGLVVFTVLALIAQPERALSTAITLSISGLVVFEIGYLFA